MARPRIFISLIIAVPLVAGMSQLYRTHLETRLVAAIDLALVVVLSVGIVKLFQRFEE